MTGRPPLNPELWDHLCDDEDGFDGIDLSQSNPTRQSVAAYRELAAVSVPLCSEYDPDPAGPAAIRESIARQFYPDPSGERIRLACSTSEMYGTVLRMFTKPGDRILIGKPGYPLLDQLALLHHLKLDEYRFRYDTGCWNIDREHFTENYDSFSGLMVVINPNNPTGHFLSESDVRFLYAWAGKRNVVLVVDEVFDVYDYRTENRFKPDWGKFPGIVFRLNGASKQWGLPHLKLAWMHLTCPVTQYKPVLQAWDFIMDTYLNLSPLQSALFGKLADVGSSIRQELTARVQSNYACLKKHCSGNRWDCLPMEGGWNAVVRFPLLADPYWYIGLEEHESIRLMPGEFFGLQEPATGIFSLIIEPAVLENALARMGKLLMLN